jgi:hypothetical protein
MKPGIPKDADGKPVHPIGAEYLKPVVDKYLDDGKHSIWVWFSLYQHITMNYVTG